MSDKLTEYRKKRDFAKTAEPTGRKTCRTPTGRLHFAVQYHIARRKHYDFRLEWDGVLLSWAVPKGPSLNTADKRLAVRVEDHPLDYARFEGTIPKGQYGGGTVMLWDEGEWEPQPGEEFAEGLKTGSLKIVLYGKRLMGKWALVRLKDRGDGGDNWLLIKEKDEFARSDEGLSGFTASVLTGRTVAQIERADAAGRKNPIDKAAVQLARPAETVPEGDGWLFEVKYDGYRILAFVEDGKVCLRSRNGHDYTDKFRLVSDALARFSDGRAMVLDGEMVVPDEQGRTDFSALQQYVRSPDGKDLVYMIFDLLALDGQDLRSRPLIERKERLEKLLENAPPALSYSRHVVGDGNASFEAAAELGLEGIVGKKLDSPYAGMANGDWIKLKCYHRQEFVLGGYTRTAKKTDGVSALLLGVYENGSLLYAGRAGTGLNRQSGNELEKTFSRLITGKTPFADPPEPKRDEQIFWLRPRLVGEVQFAEWTDENRLRQASFKGLRSDKAPEEVVRETPTATPRRKKAALATAGRASGSQTPQRKKAVPASARQASNTQAPQRKKAAPATARQALNTQAPQRKKAAPATARQATERTRTESKSRASGGDTGKRRSAYNKTDGVTVGGVTISSPDKIVFRSPEVTKLDVIRYYESVAPRMLPYVGGRVLSVVRCHKGVTGGCFFKKHPAAPSEGVQTVPVTNADGETSDYFYIFNRRGLLTEAQLGSLEFHVWGSRVNTLEKPDMLVFDLDPDEGMPLDKVRRGVRDLKSVLDSLSLKSFLKTSGGKGYHVVVPLQPSCDWQTFHDFARQVAQLMESKWPDRYTSNIRKNKRQGKIFIDWARNGRGATSVAPYSLRARPGARVSMPIAWKELATVAPDGVDLSDALERLKKPDPWKNFFRLHQRLRL